MEKSLVLTSYGASAVTFIAGLTINEWVALGGLVLGIATFAVNLWFKHQHLKLAKKHGHTPRSDKSLW